MAEETIFSKIIRREIPADIVYQDELVTAFRDINPQAPTHILIVPNKLIPTVADVSPDDEAALGRLFTAAARIAQEEGIADDGYRLIVNCTVARKSITYICTCWADDVWAVCCSLPKFYSQWMRKIQEVLQNRIL